MSDIHCDKNGDYVLSRGMLALITVVMILIGAISTVAATGTTFSNDIDYLKKQQAEDTVALARLEEKITICEKHTISTDVRLGQIKADLGEIKTDVKEMLRK